MSSEINIKDDKARMDNRPGKGNWFDRHHLGFINLVLYVFVPHSSDETDRLSYVKPRKSLAASELWPRPWLYSRVFLLFAVSFAILYWIWILEGRGQDSTLFPGLAITGALATPLSMVIFFYECNKSRSVPLLRVLQFMLVGSVAAVAITFLLTLLINYCIEWQVTVPGNVRSSLHLRQSRIQPLWFVENSFAFNIVISDFIEEFGKTLLIFAFLMRYRNSCHVLQGMLIGASVGAGFAVFESAGYASVGSSHLLQSILERSLMAPVCHTGWGAIIGGGISLLVKIRLRWKMLFSLKFSLIFLAVVLAHFLWNYSLCACDDLTLNVQLGVATVFVILLMMWLGIHADYAAAPHSLSKSCRASAEWA